MKNKMELLAKDIYKWCIKKNLWGDNCLYFDGKAWASWDEWNGEKGKQIGDRLYEYENKNPNTKEKRFRQIIFFFLYLYESTCLCGNPEPVYFFELFHIVCSLYVRKLENNSRGYKNDFFIKKMDKTIFAVL